MSHTKELSLEEYPQELTVLADKTTELFDYVQEGQEAVEQLTDMKAALEAAADDLNGLALEMVKQYSGSIYKRLGVTGTSVSLESNNTDNKNIAVEDIGQKIKDILKAIWAFIAKAFNKAKEFLLRLFGFNKKLEEKAEEINKTAKQYQHDGFTADIVDFVVSSTKADQSTQDVIDKFAESNRTQEAVKKTDIAEHLKKMREETRDKFDKDRAERIKAMDEFAAQKRAANEKPTKSGVDEIVSDVLKTKSMVIGGHVANLLKSGGTVIKPAELINRLENLYKLTDEIINRNTNIYSFWTKYNDLIDKEHGDTFFRNFMSKQQLSFYSELNAPSSFKLLKEDTDSDYRKQFSTHLDSYPLDMEVIISVPVFKPVNTDGNLVENDVHQWTNNLTLASACGVKTNVTTTAKYEEKIPVLDLKEIIEISEIVSLSSNRLQRVEKILVIRLEYLERSNEDRYSLYDKFSKSKVFQENPHSNRLWQFINTCQMDLSKVITKDVIDFFSEVSKINKACLEYCQKSKDVHSQSFGNLQKLFDSVNE